MRHWRRLLVTYLLPIAVLAIGLVLGMAAAFMAFRSGPTGPVEASVQQVAIDSPQVIPLGSANDPGGGQSSTLDQNTIVTSMGSPSVLEDPGSVVVPAYHLIGPIATQTVSANNLSDNASISGASEQMASITITTIAGHPTLVPALLQSSCSKGNTNNLHNITATLLSNGVDNPTLNDFTAGQHRITPARIAVQQEGVLGGVGAPPQLACNVCKGGNAFTDDSFARLRTKGVSPDGTLPSGTRTY